MKTEISFCPLCAGKLDAGDDEQYVCEDCESQFFIQVVEGEEDEDEDEEA
jgi:hypothetical protein